MHFTQFFPGKNRVLHWHCAFRTCKTKTKRSYAIVRRVEKMCDLLESSLSGTTLSEYSKSNRFLPLFSHENGTVSVIIWMTKFKRKVQERKSWWTPLLVVRSGELGFGCLNTEIRWMKLICQVYPSMRGCTAELPNGLGLTPFSDP